LLDRNDLWDLVDKTECFHTPELGEKHEQRVTIAFEDGSTVTKMLAVPQDVNPGLSNEEILEKFRRFMTGIVDDQRRDAIERLVLGIEKVEDINVLEEILAGPTKNPID
jgi:aconitate decarboxylase